MRNPAKAGTGLIFIDLRFFSALIYDLPPRSTTCRSEKSEESLALVQSTQEILPGFARQNDNVEVMTMTLA